MKVRVEVWPLAADSVGIWLLSGNDAWRSRNVPSDDEPHSEVGYLLAENGSSISEAALVHSTSWRVDGPAVYLTYMVVMPTPGLVRDRWADALPVSSALPGAVGKPLTHAPTEAPTPRYIDVLLHGLRHLRFLLDADVTNATALNEDWRTHLAPMEPALAAMYDRHHGMAERR
jgi:hypothetical protein